MSIKLRILFGFLFAIIIGAGGMTGLTAYEMSNSAKEQYWKTSLTQLSVADRYLTSFFGEYLRTAAFLAQIPDLANSEEFFLDFSDPNEKVTYDVNNLDLRAQELVMLWRQMHKSNPSIFEIFTGYPNRRYGTSLETWPASGFDSSKRPWYVAVTNSSNPSVIGSAYMSQTGDAVVAVAHKILSPTGALVGALGIDINLNTLNSFIDDLNFGKTGFFVLIEESGRVLANPKFPNDNFKMIADLPDKAWQKIFNADKPTMDISIGGTDMFVSSFKSETGFRILSIVSADEIYANMYTVLWNISFLTLLGLICISAVTPWFISSIFSPLNLLIVGASKLAKGDFAAIPAKSFFYGEILTLRNAMAHMAVQLKEQLGFAQSIMHGITMPFVITDTNGKITYINEQFMEYWELKDKNKDYIGRSAYAFFKLEPNKKSLLEQTINSGVPQHQVPYTHFGDNNKKKYMHITTTLLKDMDGILLGGSMLISDMTDAHEQQNRILSLNEQIIASTKNAQIISQNQNRTFSALVDQLQMTSQTATEQEQASDKTTTQLDAMIQTLEQLAEKSKQTAESSQETRKEALEGQDIVQKTKDCISEMAKQADNVEKGMGTLRDEAESINRIVDLIKDVADQTNLLALNAAIEAARAGEAGRGFAVVADEVRKLAEKTMQATIEVNNNVAALQSKMNESIDQMGQTVKLIHLSNDLAAKSEESLVRIVAIAEHSVVEVTNMAEATLEQSEAGNEVSSSMQDIKERAHQTVLDMRDSELFVEELAASATKLKVLMDAMGNERRVEKRIQIDMPMHVTLKNSEGLSIKAKILDINTSGMCLELPSGVEILKDASYTVSSESKIQNAEFLAGISGTIKWKDLSLCGMMFSKAINISIEDITKCLDKFIQNKSESEG